jgi:hypothetical protein
MSEQAPARTGPDPWEKLQALVLDSVSSPQSKRAYAKALECRPMIPMRREARLLHKGKDHFNRRGDVDRHAVQ